MVEGSETTEWELHFVVFFADIDVILFVAKHSVARVAGFLAMAKTAMGTAFMGTVRRKAAPRVRKRLPPARHVGSDMVRQLCT